ncbi:MAG: polysaccharide biosynthesis tyrosine autokinase [Lachnospiraceae bacterium]|nr:polysaccharide biosynthesis tyrosine autokinase [Lachnospiraceae bacterium]
MDQNTGKQNITVQNAGRTVNSKAAGRRPADDALFRLDEINIRSVIQDVLKNFWVVILLAVSAWMCVSAYAKIIYVPEYTSTVTFAVSAKGSSSPYSALDTTKEMAEVFGEVFQSNVLRTKVAEAMGTDSIDGTVTTEVIPETNLLKVSVVSGSPESAFCVLKLILENYPSISDYLFGNAVLEIIKNPQVPTSPSNYFYAGRYQKLAALAAAALAVCVIALMSVLRDTVQTKQAAKRKLDGRLFGYIGHEAKKRAGKTAALICNSLVSYHFMEAYKSLCSKLDFHMRRRSEKVILISSASENEGKSTVAANLALALAANRKKVLLLDCDFRKPALHKVFEIDTSRLTDFGSYLTKETITEPDVVYLEKQGIYVTINKNGYSSPQRMITSERMKAFLEKAGQDVDYIIIDSPPMMIASDAEALARLTDASLLVVRQDCTATGDINDCMDILRQSSPDFIGYVLNDFQEGTLKIQQS